jgi:predicted dehydrogenase
MKPQLGVMLVAGLFAAASNGGDLRGAEPDVRFMIVDPGHFHAGLVQKEMYPDVAKRVDVFAPLGPDLIDHLNRIAAFNRRAEKPTSWEVEVHTSPDFFERMLGNPPGNVVILSGRNRTKIDRIARSVGAGLHVLADKPWILKSEDLPKLEQALAAADAKGRAAYDIMTERFEVTNSLQRAFVGDKATFGETVAGSVAEPGVYMESVHYLKKVVAGVPNIRPSWFFDNSEQGEGLNDVGTHLVDLVQWTLFPNQSLKRSDVEVIAAQRWPTVIPEAEFRTVTNAPKFPDNLAGSVKDAKLEYYANTLVSYTVRGIHTKLNVIWDWEPPAGGGDTHFAFYRGSRSKIEIRQTRADRYQPQLYIVPNTPALKADVLAAVRARVASLQPEYSGIAVADQGSEIKIEIPDKFRVGHEAHFAEVTTSFLKYLRSRGTMPAWERPNMITKYFVSTKGTELSREGAPKVAPRIAPQ